MVMVSHQIRRVDLPTRLGAGFSQRFNQVLAIYVINESTLAPVPASIT
jgi:hypothetical protein